MATTKKMAPSDVGEDDHKALLPGNVKIPLPDLRFEQSYLRSIEKADDWLMVAYITARDQMFMPFLQGFLYNLALCAWKSWRIGTRKGGKTMGAKIRTWCLGLNKTKQL